MSKLIGGIVGIVVLVVIGLLGLRAFRNVKLPVDLATTPWIEHKFYTDRLALDVPWQLTTETSSTDKIPLDGRTVTAVRYGAELVVSVSPASPSGDLDIAMDRMAQSLKADPGFTILSEKRKEESILGGKSITLYLSIRDRLWRKMDTKILFFKFDDRLYQVHCTTPMGDPTADKVWERMRKSIRFVKVLRMPAETLSPMPESWLPNGMRRR